MLIGRALKQGPPMGLQDRLRIQFQTVEGEQLPSYLGGGLLGFGLPLTLSEPSGASVRRFP